MQFIISTSEFDVIDSLVLGLGRAYRDRHHLSLVTVNISYINPIINYCLDQL